MDDTSSTSWPALRHTSFTIYSWAIVQRTNGHGREWGLKWKGCQKKSRSNIDEPFMSRGVEIVSLSNYASHTPHSSLRTSLRELSVASLPRLSVLERLCSRMVASMLFSNSANLADSRTRYTATRGTRIWRGIPVLRDWKL